MSLFDTAAGHLMAGVKAVYGDNAVYRPKDGAPQAITVVVAESTLESGGDYETISQIKTAEIEKGDVDGPVAGDALQITTGNYIGTWLVGGIESEDEYTWIVSIS